MWARPARAPGCWRSPPSSHSCVVISQNRPDAGGVDGMAHGQQATGRADRDPAADVELTGLKRARGVTGWADAHRLDVEELLDGESVVQLDDVNILGADAGVAERWRGRLAGERG